MNFLRVLPARRRRRHAQHRLVDEPLHRGWEGIEDQVRLLSGGLDLLAGDALPTTKPLRGRAALTRYVCPLDQCLWPETDVPGVDPYGRLMEHIRRHASPDIARTIWRLRDAVETLQKDLP